MYKVKKITVLAILFFHALGACESGKPLFENKKVLITGGAGFLGRALTKEILKYNPCKIFIFSRDEVKHHAFLDKLNDKRVESILGDIRDYESIQQATRDVDIVIHAGALKRADMLEYHVPEAIHTNILGTLNVARACLYNKVKQVLLVSTDKACSPVNAYGGSKYMAEKIFSYFSTQSKESKFLTVRYGNVLESTGSVIPYFCEKIKNNQKIPITDKSMTRFFIAKEQALELIFKALMYGHGGEIFVPNLPAFKIIDLAMVLQKKLAEYPGVEIIGLRPGEKIHEVMINHAEVSRTYRFKDMFVILPTTNFLAGETNCIPQGQKVDPQEFSEYSSGDCILSWEELDALLNRFNIQISSTLQSAIRRVI